MQFNKETKVTITEVDSIPCSIIGQSIIVDYAGNRISEKLKTPWKMDWIDAEIKKLFPASVENEDKVVINPMEPDQWIKIHVEKMS